MEFNEQIKTFKEYYDLDRQLKIWDYITLAFFGAAYILFVVLIVSLCLKWVSGIIFAGLAEFSSIVMSRLSLYVCEKKRYKKAKINEKFYFLTGTNLPKTYEKMIEKLNDYYMGNQSEEIQIYKINPQSSMSDDVIDMMLVEKRKVDFDDFSTNDEKPKVKTYVKK